MSRLVTLPKFKITLIWLLIIVLIGFFLRTYKIAELPLYGDELTLVYDAYSILKTGHDQTGDFLPLTFQMGAGRPGGYIYALVPFVAIFGPSEWGVRTLSVLSGLGIIILTYLLGKKLFNQKIGLIAAAITAVSPWDIALSRGGFEAHLALFLAVLGVYLFILAKDKPWFYILSALSFGLTLHTYPTYKLTLPFLLIILFLYQGKILVEKKVMKFLIISGFVLTFFVVLAGIQTFTGGSESRFLNINAFSQKDLKESLIQKVNEERTLDELPPVISRFFHNQQDEYIYVLGESYLKNFSQDFLFFHGDGNPRHNMSTMGEFYLIEMITIFLGIIFLWKENNRKNLTFLLLWIVITPLGSFLLLETHALRNALMLPPLILLSSIGLYYFWQLTQKRNLQIFRFILLLVFALQFLVFLDRIYFLSPNRLSRFWSSPAKMASEIALDQKNNYQYIILSDRVDNLEFAYPVYAKLNPSIVINQNLNKSILSEYQLKQFENIYIGNIPVTEINNLSKSLNASSILYIGPANDKDTISDGYETLIGRDGQVALVIKKIKN